MAWLLIMAKHTSWLNVHLSSGQHMVLGIVCKSCVARAGRVDVGGTVTARDIIIATGSVPFVPPGIPIDGKTVRYCHPATHLRHAT